jgi:hypothetical protein
MRRCAVVVVGGLGFALSLAACSGASAPRAPVPAREAPRFAVVPPTAPDFIPDDLYADSSIIEDTEYTSGPFLRDVIGVAFMPGATQAERQAAIDTIGGVVIGGMAYANDGDYYVRIAGDSTGEAVTKAVDLLESLPQVYAAWVIIVPTGGELNELVPSDTGSIAKWVLQPDLFTTRSNGDPRRFIRGRREAAKPDPDSESGSSVSDSTGRRPLM